MALIAGGQPVVIKFNTNDFVEVCYNKTISPTGLWRAENPMMSSLPLLVIQLVSTMFICRVLIVAFRPLRQPRIVAEIMGGFLMGPNALRLVYPLLFPFSGTLNLETVANLALVYHIFLVGLELDLKPIIRAGKKALSIALVGVIFSAIVGWALYRYLLFKNFPELTKGRPTENGPIFCGITLATTNFPDLARILLDLKLLYSDIGSLALSASVISDLCSWFLLLLVMTGVNHIKMIAVGSTLAFIALCVFIVRPILTRIITKHEKAQEDNNYNELACYVLAGVVLSGLITDACGSHSIVGPFVLGAIIPKGEFSNMLIEKLGSFVRPIMMALFYYTTGIRVDFIDVLYRKNALELKYGTTLSRVVVVIFLAFAAKIFSTFVAALINKMSLRDSLALGVLMNTKGLLTLIILNSAREVKALNKQTFAIMMASIWAMTVFVGPFLSFAYKPRSRPCMQYEERNIQSIAPNSDLRILACTHAGNTSSNVMGIINLIDASNPTKQSPISLFVVNLVELTGHASAMLIVHDACKTTTSTSDLHLANDDSSASNAFEIYAHQRESVTLKTLTAVSAYTTMHEDICNLAEDKRAAIIIIPFHQQSTINVDGGAAEDSNSHLRSLNNKLIENARCSVGVFVDRGLGRSKITEYSKDDLFMGKSWRHHFAMFFIGGADDREALAYAWRMARHPKVNLTIIRLNVSKEAAGNSTDDDGILEAIASTEEQQKLDDLYMDEFRLRSMNDAAVEVFGKMVTSWEQTITLMNDMADSYDMFIVGRRHGNMSRDVAAVSLTCDDNYSNDQLGVLGDALVSSSFMASTSILVVQQHAHLDELGNKMG